MICTKPARAALAVAAGGRLEAVQDSGSHLTFHVAGLDAAAFEQGMADGSLMIPGRAVESSLDHLLSMIRDRQRKAGRAGSR